MSHKRSIRRKESGFAAILVVLLAATLASLSMLTIDFGINANRVSNEKQLLDAHGVIVGKQIITQGLSGTCDGGRFTGDTDQISAMMFSAIGSESLDKDDRIYECEDLGTVTREAGDPGGPPGTYRRYRVSSTYNAGRRDNNPDSNTEGYKRSVIVEVPEIGGQVERPRPNIMFVLDYSGSMGRNNRNKRLEDAVREFISVGYEVEYGVIFFDHRILKTIPISSGSDHDSRVRDELNRLGPQGGTSFNGPIRSAVQALNQASSVDGNQHSYIVLVSDGEPQDKGSTQSYVNNTIRGIDPDICIHRSGNQICHTIYALGVDGADMGMLRSISGNAATPPSEYETFAKQITAQNTQFAFRSIVDDILCSFGPIEPQPTPDEEHNITVFLNDEPLKTSQNEDESDFSYDRNINAVRLYDVEPRNACSRALENNGNITIRYGKPRVIPEEAL